MANSFNTQNNLTINFSFVLLLIVILNGLPTTTVTVAQNSISQKAVMVVAEDQTFHVVLAGDPLVATEATVNLGALGVVETQAQPAQLVQHPVRIPKQNVRPKGLVPRLAPVGL